MNRIKTPDEIFGELFIEMHNQHVCADEKSISDAIPKLDPDRIIRTYDREKDQADFDLKEFVNKYFEFPESPSSGFEADTSRDVKDHIELLWDVLKRDADKTIPGSSLIPLPKPYIVPGGRFNEIYYWDSYFTMLGLAVSKRYDTIQNMVDNFAYLIDTLGFIPNGNRSYFQGRSQPPFFACMVQLLAELKGEEILVQYLPQLLKEYSFWMDGQNILGENSAHRRLVFLEKGDYLNRYWDDDFNPRQEMHATDVELARSSFRNEVQIYQHIRAACESGWDFSCRWFEDPMDLKTIHTTDLIQVDLNCLIYNLEIAIADAHAVDKNDEGKLKFQRLADNRKRTILKYFWDPELGYFFDYNWKKNQRKGILSLAGIFPLFFNIATPFQAASTSDIVKSEFIRPGGVVSSVYQTGQQWDAPNGWAPLQWMTYKGLKNYDYDELANEIKKRWTKLNSDVYKRTGKLMEKYNVEDTTLLSGGGEYPVQDGFGWTNGVLLKMLHED